MFNYKELYDHKINSAEIICKSVFNNSHKPCGISFVTDVLFASNFSRNFSTFIILLTMYLVSAAIRFVQELKSKRTTDYLASLVETDVTVWCDGQWEQTSSSELKPGDKILLEAGAKIPSNVKLTTASDFYIS